MTSLRLLAIAVIASACASLPDISPSCGNGVLDPGEDCDTPDDSRCQACGWTCATTADCAAIPAPRDGSDYACGADGFCHAAGGELAAQSGQPLFAAQQFYVTDLDGDGYGDAVGVSTASITTLSGDPAGALTASRTTPTAAAAGAPVIADINGDGPLDVLLPTRDGIVAYASPAGTISPFSFAFESSLRVLPQVLVPIDRKRFAVLTTDPLMPAHLIGSIVDISVLPPTFTTFPLCDVNSTVAGLERDSVDFYDTTTGGKPSVEFSFTDTNTTGAREFCVVSIIEDPAISPVTFATDHTVSEVAPVPRAMFAELEPASTCPALIDSSGGPKGLVQYPGQRNGNGDGTCILLDTPQSLPPVPGATTDVMVGRARLDPAPTAAPFVGDALVMSSGVYAVGSNAEKTYYVADRPLTGAATGDVDGDGRADTVAPGIDESIDVLHRTVNPDGFLRGRIETHSPPTQVTVGDFDGNGVADVAYIEREPNGNSLQISYGTPTELLAPIETASFAEVLDLARVNIGDSADPNDLIDGLAVLEIRNFPVGPTEVASGFHGSVDRELIPFFDPLGTGAQSAYRAAASGHFVPGETTLDMLAIAVPDPANPDPNAQLWRFQGQDPGGINFPVPPLTSQTGATDITSDVGPIGDCEQGSAGFCLDTAVLVTWPSVATDIAIAISPESGLAMVIDPAAVMFPFPPSTSPQTLATQPIALSKTSTITGAFVADLDGDGTNELVIASTEGVLACSVSAGVLSCHDLAAAVGILGTCTAAVRGRLGPPSVSDDLVTLCGGTVYRVFFDGQLESRALDVPGLPADIDAIDAADVTGDAIDDLLVLATDPDGLRRLHVFPQLTSRQAQ